MASCKDCLHVEACSRKQKIVIDGLNRAAQHAEKFTNKKIEVGCSKEENFCELFCDRSRFVELPCKVGDTVYMLTEQTQKIGHKKVTKTVIVECCVDNFRIGDAGYPSAALCDNENVWCYGVEPIMFGEIIFLSREEAEQALKERE